LVRDVPARRAHRLISGWPVTPPALASIRVPAPALAQVRKK